MKTQKLKRVYNAARALNGHNQETAAKQIGKSQSMINQVLSGTATSKPVLDGVTRYCYDAGLRHTIKKIGLDPDAKVKMQRQTV